ncbi:MAG: hypothetical protein FVQ79_00985 [Planctomycetes bacterium]|nr:hypothetical protein [Planctomycetota bacterium]
MYDDAIPDEAQQPYHGAVVATQWQFLWICALVLSFCYELPLVKITSMDRLNPRLFDVVFLIGLVTILPGLKGSVRLPKLFRIWAGIVAVFCICALAWFPFFPWYYGKYCIFFALKYVEGFLCIYAVAKIQLTSNHKRILHNLVIVGGIVVAVYAIPEYFGRTRSTAFAVGKEYLYKEGTLFSCLGMSYFHVSMFSAVSSFMALARFNTGKSMFARLKWIGLGFFVAWPALFSGCRAGFAAWIIGGLVLLIISQASYRRIVVGVSILLAIFMFVTGTAPKLSTITEKSLTLQRFELGQSKGKGDTIKSRSTLDWYNLSAYRRQGIRIPFIGAGFYVAPNVSESGAIKYRIGYGIHNSYLFAIEQGGLAAFFLFIWFLRTCWKGLKRRRLPGSNESDRMFATGMWAYLCAILVVMQGGQIFWYGFGKVNFNTYIILLFVLAASESFSDDYEDGYAIDFETEQIIDAGY